MVLPDWSSAIFSMANTFLAWGTVAQMVSTIVGMSVATTVLAMFMRVFVR